MEVVEKLKFVRDSERYEEKNDQRGRNTIVWSVRKNSNFRSERVRGRIISLFLKTWEAKRGISISKIIVNKNSISFCNQTEQKQKKINKVMIN